MSIAANINHHRNSDTIIIRIIKKLITMILPGAESCHWFKKRIFLIEK